MWLAAGPERGGSEGKAPGKRMGAPVADAPANAAGDEKGAILDHAVMLTSSAALCHLTTLLLLAFLSRLAGE